MSDLDALEEWVAPLLQKLAPAQRKALARKIAQQLRQRQSRRIAAQQNPGGSPFAPRKPQNRQRQGAIRNKVMFSKIRQTKYLRQAASPIGAEVGFISRVAKIARTHQYGLRDRVAPDGPMVQYPRRELLGFSAEDRDLVRDLLIEHLT